MKLPLWAIIPTILFLTLIYLGLGIQGHWNYNYNDFINGNIIVSSIIGIIYLGEHSYNKIKKWQA